LGISGQANSFFFVFQEKEGRSDGQRDQQLAVPSNVLADQFILPLSKR
jgi:hypothetical protein